MAKAIFRFYLTTKATHISIAAMFGKLLESADAIPTVMVGKTSKTDPNYQAIMDPIGYALDAGKRGPFSKTAPSGGGLQTYLL